MKILKEFFGKTKESREVYLYTLQNDRNMSVSIMTFGGAVVKLLFPDRTGSIKDLICGYDTLSYYENADGYQGALIGRFGNRIKNGRFTLDGKEYILAKNDGNNHLHGGKRGFSHRIWDVVRYDSSDSYACLELSYISCDGEEGYPGELKVNVEYSLDNNNRFEIKYTAVTDKKTILNLTNHTYFNLGGYASGSILDHEIAISADKYLKTDSELIPTCMASVENTPFDFRKFKTVGKDFYSDSEDIRFAGGYDHCFVFSERDNYESTPVIIARNQESGIQLELTTDMPCVHFYTGNFLKNEKYNFKGSYPQKPQSAFCLETELMPDSINHSDFTDCTLDAGQTFKSFTAFKFGNI